MAFSALTRSLPLEPLSSSPAPAPMMSTSYHSALSRSYGMRNSESSNPWPSKHAIFMDFLRYLAPEDADRAPVPGGLDMFHVEPPGRRSVDPSVARTACCRRSAVVLAQHQGLPRGPRVDSAGDRQP